MALKRINAIIQFIGANKAAYDAFPFKIPEHYLVYSIDTKEMRLGDGKHTFAQLPNLIDLDAIRETIDEEEGTSWLKEMTISDVNKILIVADDGRVAAGPYTVQEILDALDPLNDKNNAQDITISELSNIFNKIDVNINENNNDSMVVVNNTEDKFIPDMNMDDYINSISSDVYDLQAFLINSIDFFSDELFINNINTLPSLITSYAKVEITNTANLDLTVELTSDNPNIEIIKISDTAFSITPNSNASSISPTTFTATVSANNETVFGNPSLSKSISQTIDVDLPQLSDLFFVGDDVNSGPSYDSGVFNDIIFDQTNNIYIAVGQRDINDSYCAIAVAFDQYFRYIGNITLGKINPSVWSTANSVMIDNNGDIIVVGFTNAIEHELISGGSDEVDGIISKLRYNPSTPSTPFTFLNSRIFGRPTDSTSTNTITEFTCVAEGMIDGELKYILGGRENITTINENETSGLDNALIVILNNDLSFYKSKIFIGSNRTTVEDLKIDNNGDIVAIGNVEYSKGAYIAKFDSSLNEITNYMLTNDNEDTRFNKITITSSNEYIVVGFTRTESNYSGCDGFIGKFDSNLTVQGSFVRIESSDGLTEFTDIAINPDGLIYLIGRIFYQTYHCVYFCELSSDFSSLIKQYIFFNVNSYYPIGYGVISASESNDHYLIGVGFYYLSQNIKRPALWGLEIDSVSEGEYLGENYPDNGFSSTSLNPSNISSPSTGISNYSFNSGISLIEDHTSIAEAAFDGNSFVYSIEDFTYIYDNYHLETNNY